MGNLNCFTSYNDRKRSQWFNEWQNNSSHEHPYYDYYDRNMFERMNSNDMWVDPANFGYYEPNTNYPPLRNQRPEIFPSMEPIDNYELSMSQYNKNIYKNNQIINETDRPNENELHDNVTEAFMSDWFAREEAELNSNIKALQECDLKSESEHEIVADKEEKRKESMKASEIVERTTENSSKCSSDSGMCNLDDLKEKNSKSNLPMGFSIRKNGYCCYTAYIMCSNTCEWDNFLAKTARMMTGLQRQFQCTIRFSDKISFFRGNSVRTFQIIGSNKGNIIKCKVALPQAMVKLLITPMSGSTDVEEYSKECNINRETINRRK